MAHHHNVDSPMEIGGMRGFFNRFVPASILESGQVEAQLRARVLTGLYFTNVIITMVVLLICLVEDFVFHANMLIGYMSVGIAAVCLGLQIWLFYLVANVVTSGIIFSMAFFGITLATVVLTGGWNSPLLLLLFCSPAISFLVGGRNEGFYMSFIVIACAVGLILGSKNGMQLFQILPDEHMELARFTTWTVATLTLTSCLAVYDSLLQSATRYLDRH